MNVRALFQERVASKFGPHEYEIMGHYDTLVHTYGEDRALDVILDACQKLRQLQTTASLPLSPRAEEIRKQLEIANRTKTVETNSLLRLRSVIERLRQNIGKCRVEIDGQEFDNKEVPLPKVPDCFKNGLTTYTASARCKDGKVKSLTLDIIS